MGGPGAAAGVARRQWRLRWQQTRIIGTFAAAMLIGLGFVGKLVVARLATPKGETHYGSYQATEGYRRIAGDGYSITKHDYRKDAYARLKLEGLSG